MTDRFYREYLVTPTARYADEFIVSLFMLRTLDRMKLMEVEACHRACAHDHVMIYIDRLLIDENIVDWLRRHSGI